MPQDRLMIDPNLITKPECKIDRLIYDSKASEDVSTLIINPVELDNKIEIKQKDGSMIFSIPFPEILSANYAHQKGFNKKDLLEIKMNDGKVIQVYTKDKNAYNIGFEINQLVEAQKYRLKLIAQPLLVENKPTWVENYWNPLQPKLAENEEILWSHPFVEKNEILAVDVLTNFRVMGYLFRKHEVIYEALDLIDDVVVANQHRESQSTRTGSFSGVGINHVFGGTSYGESFGTSNAIGDVIFMRDGKEAMAFEQVSDPHGIASLAKSAIKFRTDLLEQLSLAEKQQQKSTVTQDGRTLKEIMCPKCKNSIPNDSEFCNHCGIKIQGLCSKCGHDNPKESVFCNKCGFALR